MVWMAIAWLLGTCALLIQPVLPPATAPAPSVICWRIRERRSAESKGAYVTVSLVSGTATGALTP